MKWNMDKETIRAVIETVEKTKTSIITTYANKVDSGIGSMNVIDADIFLAELQKLIDSPSTEKE